MLWSFLYFFFLLSAYYILRPMREARGVGVGSQWLPAAVRRPPSLTLLAG